MLWNAVGADDKYREFGWRIDADGHTPVDSFRVIRDGSANMHSAVVDVAGHEITIEQIPKRSRFNGWWLPMGGRQEGPAFCEYNEFANLRAASQLGAGVVAHGVLRRLH